MKNHIHLLTALGLLMIAGIASAAPHKARVNDPALAKSLVAQGGRLVADYGAFQIVETDDAALAGQDASKVELKDEFDFIELNAKRLDTRTAEVKALRKPVGAFTGKRLHLLQFTGPIKPKWRAELEKSGARIVSYIPNNAYLVYGDAATLAKMQNWAATNDFVQWDGTYADEYKIHPRARVVDEKGRPQKPATDLFAIQLVDDTNANASILTLIDGMKLEPVRSQSHLLNYFNVIVRLPPERLNEIAARPEVISIQPYFQPKKLDERQDQILAGNLAGNVPSGAGYLAWLANKGFTQAQFTTSGFVVDVSDSGIDNGTTTPGHFALYQLGNTSQASRVVYSRLEGKANSGSTLQGCDGHGTLNSHIISGYSDHTNGFPHSDSAGFAYGLGVCPFVRVGASVVFDPDNFTSPNYANLQSQAYNNGARISNNSWGDSGSAGAYNTDAQAYDALVRDAQPSGSTYPTSGNQQMVIVFAAGNDGPSGQTVNAPGTAKNVITVGASENVRSLLPSNGGNDASGNDGCGEPDSSADSANDIISFSSRGPCSDGRMKPDIVAPGTHVSGGVAQNSPPPSPSGTGSAISCFDGTGVCGLPGSGTTGNADNFFPLNQQFYTVSSGTSHSTPAVAGACALVRQYFINNNLAAPSPAMTKACLMNSARYLSGANANDTLWSANQGMGEVNLGVAFDGVSRVLRDQISTDKFTATGQTRTFVGTVADPTKPFRVTLAWTDAPGSTTSSSALDNDLDLTVTVGGVTYKGNVFSGAFSTTGGTSDSKNNVENVFLPAGTSGSFIATVTAANINSDGVPNESPSQDQDFALVVYNALQGAVPVIAVDNYTVVGENCYPTNGAIDPGETATVNFSLKNVGTANTANLVVTLLPTNGVTQPSGSQTYGALLTGGADVTRSFSFTANGDCGSSISVTFQLQDGTSNLGNAIVLIPLGQISTVFKQNFDGVTVPTLPSGWTTSASNAQSAWVTSTAAEDTSPNAAFSPDPASAGINQLVSLAITLPPGDGQLSFQNYYNLESSSSSPSVGYDGGVLEIKIGSGSFTDILAAGGGFASGGYNCTISSSFGNPLAGRQAWSGDSGGFIATVVNLPSAAAGQTVQFRWRCGSDSSVGKPGWYIDTIAITGHVCCSNIVSLADLAIGETVLPAALNLTSNLTITLVVTNFGPDTASNVAVTNALPAGLGFVSANSSQGTVVNNAGVVACALGPMTNGATAAISIKAAATVAGSWTNTATVSSGTLDPVSSNNRTSVSVSVNSPPTISSIPNVTTNENAVVGPIPFTIGDAETPASALQLTDTSSNTNLVLPGNIIFGGSSSNRTVTITPNPDQFGFSTIGITVSDGMATTGTSFLLTINQIVPPPEIEAITLTNEIVTLTWTATTGHSYRVQFKNDLLETNWSNLTPDVVAAGPSAWMTNAINTTQRFYRIMLLP